MAFHEYLWAQLEREIKLPPDFSWNFRADQKATLHYAGTNVVVELTPVPSRDAIGVRDRDISQRSPADRPYPELESRGELSIEQLLSYLRDKLAPAHRGT